MFPSRTARDTANRVEAVAFGVWHALALELGHEVQPAEPDGCRAGVAADTGVGSDAALPMAHDSQSPNDCNERSDRRHLFRPAQLFSTRPESAQAVTRAFSCADG